MPQLSINYNLYAFDKFDNKMALYHVISPADIRYLPNSCIVASVTRCWNKK